jgi:glycosyltransferase involved in cell wall biosynthesis
MRLRKLMATVDPDVVEALEPMPAIAAGLACFRRPSPPVVIYRRQHAGGRRRLLWASRLATRLTDRTIVSCQAMQQRAAIDDRCDVARIEIANPGTVDLGPVAAGEVDAARQALGIDRSARVIAAVSRFRHEKGLDLLIRSLTYLGAAGDVHLVLAGTGPEEAALRRLAALSPIPVHFLGHQNNLPLWLHVADVIVIPSRRESFGRVTLEAMAAGKPIVATRAGGLAEAVVDGKTGTLVPPDDERALASALREMLTDPALARRRGEAGRQRFLSRYTIAHMATARIQAWQRSLAAAGAR